MRGLKVYEVKWRGELHYVAATTRDEAVEIIGCSKAHLINYGNVVHVTPILQKAVNDPLQPYILKSGELRRVRV